MKKEKKNSITYPSTHHFTYYVFYRLDRTIFRFKHFIVCDVWCLDCSKLSLEYSSPGNITFIEIFNFHIECRTGIN